MLNFEGSLHLSKIGLYTQGQDRWKLHAKTIHSLMGKSGSYKAAAKSGTSGPKTCIKTVRKWMSLYKWSLYDLFWPLFGVCMRIFYKAEVLTIILRCLAGLTYDWFKRYDSKRKYFHFSFFFLILYKNRRLHLLSFFHFCVFCRNFCTN